MSDPKSIELLARVHDLLDEIQPQRFGAVELVAGQLIERRPHRRAHLGEDRGRELDAQTAVTGDRDLGADLARGVEPDRAGFLAGRDLHLGVGPHEPLGPGDIFAIMPIVNTIVSLPVSVGGVGVREGLFSVLLGSLTGLSGAVAVVISSTVTNPRSRATPLTTPYFSQSTLASISA